MRLILWLPLFFSFAAGHYYEYSYTTTGKGMDIHGVTRLYVNPAGQSRMEIDILHGHGPRIIPQTVVLNDAAKPSENLSLFSDTKTYVVNHLDMAHEPDHRAAAVTLVGRERVDGYNCVHARVITNRALGDAGRTIDTLDIWKSADVPSVASFTASMESFASRTGGYNYTPGVAVQLQALGCDGFLVALELRTPTAHTRQDLVKASSRDLSDALFQIPSGYIERHGDY